MDLLQHKQQQILKTLDAAPNTGKYQFYTYRDTTNLMKRKLVTATVIDNFVYYLEEYAEHLLKEKVLGIDVETTGLNYLTERIHGIGLSNGKDLNIYIPLEYVEIEDIVSLLNKLNKRVTWVLHNTKFDRKFIYHHLGVWLEKTIDTIILSYLLEPEGSHKLSHLAGIYLDRYPYDFENLVLENSKYEKVEKNPSDKAKFKVFSKVTCNVCEGTKQVAAKKEGKFKKCPECKAIGFIEEYELKAGVEVVKLQALADYCAEDCYEAVNLWNMFKGIFKHREDVQKLAYIENALEPILSKMELEGIAIDKDKLDSLSKNLDIELQIIMQEIGLYFPLDVKIDLNSPKQLSEFLFNYLQLPTSGVKKGKSGQYSTDADTLHSLKGIHAVIDLLLEQRSLTKVKRDFVDNLRQYEIIHCQYNQTKTATGRLSSSDPNLQNIPNPDKSLWGKEIRKSFIPKYDDYVILDLDYSQFELRILAYFSNDEFLIKAFQENLDIHTEVTKLIYGLDYYDEEKHKKLRTYVKNINFGLVYGMQAEKFSKMARISIKEAELLMCKHRDLLPGIWKFIDECKANALINGYTETILGRKRYFNFETPKLKALQGMKEFKDDVINNLDYWYSIALPQDAEKLRQCANHPIQGTNADAIKLAMINIQHWIDSEKIPAKMLLQVHDELVFEVSQYQCMDIRDEIAQKMESAISLGEVPIKVSGKIAMNWGEAK